MRRLVLACCAAAACTSGGGGPATEEVAPAEPTAHLAPSAVSYLLVSHRRGEQEFQGQVTTQSQLTRMWFTAALEVGTGDTLTVRFGIDSVVETGGTFGPADLATVRGASWTGRVAPTGQVLNLTGPAEAGLANQLYNAFEQFFPSLPAGGAHPGDRWADTVTSNVDVGGIEITVISANQSEAVGFDLFEGVEALLIRVASDYTLQGEGSQNGQPLILAGGGRRHAREFVSAGGRYLGSTIADTATIDVTLTSLGMSLPARQWRHDTLRVLR